MKVFILVKVDFGHKTIVDVFDTDEKAKAVQASLEVASFDNCYMVGLSFYIEEKFVK
jgi:hypothetical protein